MTRRDFYDDPDAPAPNSVVPAATVVVTDEAGRILLIHRTDNDMWALPGGGHDAGERITDTATREVLEETGITVELTGIVGTYTDPKHIIAYDDGEVRQQFAICFSGRPIGGELRPSSESRQVEWIPPDRLDDLDINPSMRFRIDHGLDATRTGPYLG